MKPLFYLTLLFLTIGVKSQSLVLTQVAYEPVAGDSSFYHVLDTSSFVNGLPISANGNNVVWNFSSLLSTPLKANSVYLNPAAVSGSSAHPTSNLVQKQGNLYNYFKSVTSPTTQTEMIAISSNSLNLTFTNTAILAKFPVAYGNSFTDNIAGTFNFSLSGTFTGSASTTADGTGTLQLPDGMTLNNVLRVKSVQTINLFLGFLPFGVAKQTVYNFFHSSQKFPVLNITYSSLTITGSTTSSLSAVVTGNSKTIIVGHEEQFFETDNVRIYPIPVNDNLYISLEDLDEPERIQVFNTLGASVITINTIGNEKTANTISFSDLPDGMYFVRIKTETKSFQKKILVNHH